MAVVSNDIKTKNFKRVYLLYGEQDYLRLHYKNALKNAIVREGDTFNYSYFEGKGIDADTVFDTVLTVPFMAEKRLVIVENSGWFGAKRSKSDKDEEGTDTEDAENDSKDNGDIVLKIINSVPEETVLVFVETAVDKRKKSFQAVTKAGVTEEYSHRTDEQLMSWLAGMAKASGKNITASTATYILDECGRDMLTLKNEMDKLTAYTYDRDVITVKDVDAVCAREVNEKIFDMIDAMAANNQKAALKVYFDLLILRESPFFILSLLSKQFRQMLAIKDGLDRNESLNDIKYRLSLKDYPANKMSGQVRRMTYAGIKANVEACAKTETDIKSGNIIDRIGVELLIIECSKRTA